MKANKFKLIVGLLSFLFLFGCNFSHKASQNNEGIYIQLHGKKYDRLFLEGHYLKFSIPSAYPQIKFEGHSEDGFRWFFDIPDSVNQSMLLYYIKTDTFHYQTKTDHLIKLNAGFANDTIKSFAFTFDDKMRIVDLYYQGTSSRQVDQYEVDDTLFWKGPISLNIDDYAVDLSNKNAVELELLMKTSAYTNFEQLDSLSVKYPDSKFLMSQLLNLRQMDKGELQIIYDRFSEKNRTSYLGRKIADYLAFNDSAFVFNNIKLQHWDDRTIQEYVIQDPDKYTLIMFSASWCGPCHSRIPLLKEIYHEKPSQLDMVYISIDDCRTLSWWSELMKKEQIPWRSLVFPNDEMLLSVIGHYIHMGIPDFILVSPGGKAKKIDLLTQDDKMKLYEMIN